MEEQRKPKSDIDRERRALALFEAMLDVAPAERAAWLACNTEGEGDLRRRVTQLAGAHGEGSVRTGGAARTLDDIPPPERVGAYRITGLIGSGGMGSVYAAERDKGDFEHEVAIKLIRPSLLSNGLIERFARERQVLAKLSHPHIARLFDGGETDEGQPYFVMERVDGVPLDRWIEQQRPSRPARLARFQQICDAVAYAHRNLVVHRDLTPANVLIDRAGRARLIDFGIAHPSGEEAEDDGEAALRRRTITPGFAAPERLDGEAGTTLADIYSLGRLLAAMIEPPRGGELRAIVDKASAADPADRYQTVDALARDVAALASGHPVSAMPPSRRYKARKLVSRNKPQFALLAALALVTVGGFAATTWNWLQAEAARDEAEQRFGEVRHIANFMLFDLYDDLASVSGNTKALENIADEARGYLERLAAGDDTSPDLRLEIAQGYHRLSNVSGNPEAANLGRRDDARTFLDRAIADLDGLHAKYPARADITAALADALYSDAILRFVGEEDNAGGIASADRSASLYRQLALNHPDRPEHRLNWYRSRLQAAKPFIWIDEGEVGVARLARLYEEVAAYAGNRPDDRAARRLQAAVASEYGVSSMWHFPVGEPAFLAAIDRFDESIEIYDRLIRTAAGAEADDLRRSVLATLFQRSLVLSDLERWDEALADLRRGGEIADRFVRADSDDLGALRRRETIDSQLINVLLGLGRTERAVAVAEALTGSRRSRAAENPDNAGYARDAAGALVAFADALREDGQHEPACRAFRDAARDWRSIEARWSLSEMDRSQNLDYATEALRACSDLA